MTIKTQQQLTDENNESISTNGIRDITAVKVRSLFQNIIDTLFSLISSISVAWDSIIGGPLSTPAVIDDASSKRHTQNTDKKIIDADGDTSIDVEESADNDIINFKSAKIGTNDTLLFKNGNSDIFATFKADGSFVYGYNNVPRGTVKIWNHQIWLAESLSPYVSNAYIEQYQNSFRILASAFKFQNTTRSVTYLDLSSTALDISALTDFYVKKIGDKSFGGPTTHLYIKGHRSDSIHKGGNVYIDGGTCSGTAAQGDVIINYNNTGNVGINNNTPSEKLDVKGNVKLSGVLKITGITTTQRDALIAVAGDLIYNTTDNKHQAFDGTSWNNLY